MENIELKYGISELNWDEVNNLFIRAPLGSRPPEAFKIACANSGVVVSAWKDGILIGFGRAITDHMAYAAIYDIVVLPEYQGKGIGSQIIQAVLDKIPNCWAITLFAEPGKENFYETRGFNRMKTAMAKFKNPSSAKSQGYI